MSTVNDLVAHGRLQKAAVKRTIDSVLASGARKTPLTRAYTAPCCEEECYKY